VLEEREVLLAHLFERAEREEPAERVLQALAHLLLIAPEGGHRVFEIARHQPLHAVAVEPNELAQEADRQQVLPAFALFLDDDLGEDGASDVLARLGVIDDEIGMGFDHAGEIVQRHIARCRRVVEASIGVFLDDDRRRFGATRVGHLATSPDA
jgi:hypothetical protein